MHSDHPAHFSNDRSAAAAWTRFGRPCACALFLIAVLGLLGGARPPSNTPLMRVHCIDVGQGDCTLIEFPCAAVMVDAGADPNHDGDVREYLERFFSRRRDLDRTIECIYITHSHVDHTSQLQDLVEHFHVKRVIDNGNRVGSGRPKLAWLEGRVSAGAVSTRLIAVRDLQVQQEGQGRGLTTADIDPVLCPTCDPQVHILSASMDANPGWPHGEFENQNNHSLVIRIDFGDSSLLFTGDLEEHAIEDLVDRYAGSAALDVDVYHVGHHGSGNGTTTSLLRAMSPNIAVISMGDWTFGRRSDGSAKSFTTYAYGHPRKQVLDMLQAEIPGRRSRSAEVKAAIGAKKFESYRVTKRIYATGWDGDLEIEASLRRDYRTRRSGP